MPVVMASLHQYSGRAARLVLCLNPGIRMSEPETCGYFLDAWIISFDTEDDPTTRYLETLISAAARTLKVLEGFLQPDPVDNLGSFLSKSECGIQNLCITDGVSSISVGVYRDTLPTNPN
jgi:hypothetical protein